VHAATKGCRRCTGLSGSGGAAGPCVAEKTRACSVQHPCAMTVWRLCSDAQTSVVRDKHTRLARCYGELQLPGAGEFPIFIGVLVQPDPRRQVACTPMSTSITERVFDATDVAKQFRERAPKRAPGRQLSYTPEVTAEIYERLEAGEPIKQFCRDAGMPDRKTLRHHPACARVRCRPTRGGSSLYPPRARCPTSAKSCHWRDGQRWRGR
jgi:hypothetical protein